MKKIKQKTHKATAKKLQKRNGGPVKFKRPGANHNTVSYRTKRLRKLRKASCLSSADAKRLKRLIEIMK